MPQERNQTLYVPQNVLITWINEMPVKDSLTVTDSPTLYQDPDRNNLSAVSVFSESLADDTDGLHVVKQNSNVHKKTL